MNYMTMKEIYDFFIFIFEDALFFFIFFFFTEAVILLFIRDSFIIKPFYGSTLFKR